MASSRFPDLPDRMKTLPLDDRGYPVPWFVPIIDGKPHFPAMDPAKLLRAFTHDLCWVCGEKLGRFKAFTIGPMCAINRTSSEPPSHAECARFSARRCPFLANPRMRRFSQQQHIARTGSEAVDPAGLMIPRNPGVALVWITTEYRMFGDGRGGRLFAIGEADTVEWYREGRRATRAEVMRSIVTGLPLLRELAAQEKGGLEALAHHIAMAVPLLPAGTNEDEVALCGLCERRADDYRVLDCTLPDCPLAKKEAA